MWKKIVPPFYNLGEGRVHPSFGLVSSRHPDDPQLSPTKPRENLHVNAKATQFLSPCSHSSLSFNNDSFDNVLVSSTLDLIHSLDVLAVQLLQMFHLYKLFLLLVYMLYYCESFKIGIARSRRVHRILQPATQRNG